MSSDQIDMTNGDSNAISIGLSWVAYMRMVPIIAGSGLALFVIAKIIGDNPLRARQFYFSLIALIIWNVYAFAVIQSKRLVINNIGVWYISGIIPWKKISIGLQWRNVGVVSYDNTLFTYLTKSYTVNVGDRYTEKIALSVANISDGAYIITKINTILATQNQT